MCGDRGQSWSPQLWLVDAPCLGRPVRVAWRKRSWVCREPACPAESFTEQDEQIAHPGRLLTLWACWWAINQPRLSTPRSWA